MKSRIFLSAALLIVLASCQKNVQGPTAQSAAAVSAQLVTVGPVVTFGAPKPIQRVESGKMAILFSDSMYVTQNTAVLQVIKFVVTGKNLSFNSYAVLINGQRLLVTPTYENGLMTLALNFPKPLPVGNYSFVLAAKSAGDSQVFTLNLSKENAIITDYRGFFANIIGLPISTSLQLM